MKRTAEKPLEKDPRTPEQIQMGKALRSDFIQTTTKNIVYHTLQLTFARNGSAEEKYHLDAIANERNHLKNYGD